MKKLIIFILFVTSFLFGKGQSDDEKSEISRDSFGFILGTNTIIEKELLHGFTLGLTYDYSINHKVFLNPQVLISHFQFKNSNDFQYELPYIELPILILIKPFDTQVEPTFAFGPNLKMHHRLKSKFLAIDFSIGVEKKLKYFTISPELRYSYSKNFSPIYLTIKIKS